MLRKISISLLYFSLMFVTPTLAAAVDSVVIPGNLSITGTGNGLVFPDMSVQTTALSFPYNAIVSTFGNTFDISNGGNGIAISGSSTGTGRAGSFMVNNPSNTSAALYASTNGSGKAVQGFTTGTSNAGSFTIDNLANGFAALYASTNGSGSAVFGTTSGNGNAGSFSNTGDGNDTTGGHAGYFQTTNSANSKATLFATSTSSGNIGFFENTNATNNKATLYAVSNGLGAIGYFENTNAANTKATVYATSNGTGAAVYGYQTGTARAGRFDISNAASAADTLYVSTNGTGNAARFELSNASSSAYAVYATTSGGTGNAGYFNGNVNIVGGLTKGHGSFKIDHPLDPRNRYLFHSFVESPDMMNIYNGTVVTDGRGYATITMPAWFEALNREFRYQLTVLDNTDSPEFVLAKVVQKMAGNTFTIRTSRPGTEVSWQVTGIRHDPYAQKHPLNVEQEKPATEKGTCLHPEACAH